MDDRVVECPICGAINAEHLSECGQCESDLIHGENVELVDEESCMNCCYYAPAADVQCPILGRKWDRDVIDIDCPDTMHCEAHTRK